MIRRPLHPGDLVSGPSVPHRPTSRINANGMWISHAPLPIEVVVFYGIVIVILLVLGRATGPSILPSPVLLLDLVVVIFLLRYVSTTYSMDSERFYARRLFGSRAIRLEDVRRIEFASLRELSPTGFFGGWGWRGRMWSPVAGSFDSIHTRSAGVMIYAGDVPLFVSPRDPAELATELSRRATSYSGSVGARTGDPVRAPSRGGPTPADSVAREGRVDSIGPRIDPAAERTNASESEVEE